MTPTTAPCPVPAANPAHPSCQAHSRTVGPGGTRDAAHSAARSSRAGLALGLVIALAATLATPGARGQEAAPAPGAAAASAVPADGSGWAGEAVILSRIKAPTFPQRDFVITDYGAVAGGTVLNSAAIAKAIEACAAAGGGRVVVPPGVYLTGAITLRSHVNLHVQEGATLLFSTDPKAYLPAVFTRWEGVEVMNYSPFIYAYGQVDIAVTGTGTLDGQGSEEHWWPWARKAENGHSPASADSKALNAMGDAGVPVAGRLFGEGHFLRPNFFQPYRCRNVLIEGLHIRRSPMWEVNPVLCTNVTVRDLDINTRGPNNDGCDPECCRDVLIEGCSFTTGDDCIAIKSGRNDDGRRINVPSENLIIRGCTMKDGHGGVVIGSEVSGGCRNVYVEDCTMDSPRLERVLRFKSNATRGGYFENIYARRLTVGQVAEAVITVDFLYEEGAKGSHLPWLRNLQVENVTVRSTPRVFYIAGLKGAPVEDIRLSHCRFEGLTSTEIIQHAGRISLEDVTIEPAAKPHSLSSRALVP